jgi:hypothetical protein
MLWLGIFHTHFVLSNDMFVHSVLALVCFMSTFLFCLVRCFLNLFEVLFYFTATISMSVDISSDRLCGLVVRVPGYRSRGPGSIPGATRFFLRSSGAGTGSTQPRDDN